MIQSKLLSPLGIVHGYATRNESQEEFLKLLGVNSEHLVFGQQVHGKRIALVCNEDRGKTLTGIDGLVSTGLPIGVTYADCVPILAVDPKVRMIGTAHAGWKGTLAGIAKELIAEMIKNGADINTIYISIGPSIGMCCYNVMDDRARAFQKKFGDNEKITSKIRGSWHLDIGYANYQTLLEAGIIPMHIDVIPVCTSCQVDEFHSFRKDTKNTFGVQLGVIAL